MIMKEKGMGDYESPNDVNITLGTGDVSGLYDPVSLTDPTTGLPASTSTYDFGSFLADAGKGIVSILPNILNKFFGTTTVPAGSVVAKPTSSGQPAATTGTTNMLLIGALAVGGYLLLNK